MINPGARADRSLRAVGGLVRRAVGPLGTCAAVLVAFSLATPAASAARPLGGNVNGQAPWTADFAFANAFVTASTPRPLEPDGSLDLDSSVPLDGNGWPKADFGVYVSEVAPPPGNYSISGSSTRRPTVGLRLTPGTVGPLTWDSRNRRFRVTVRVDSQGTPGLHGRLILTFRNTGGGVRGLRVVRPGHDAYRHPVFSDRYISFLRAHRPTVLRTMDLTATNNNPVARWSERTLPGRWGMRTLSRRIATDWAPAGEVLTSERGMAWEYAIELCNRVGSDCWINIPLHADDDYVRRLAALVESRLSSRLKVWVEYSNEVWNDGFWQTGANRRLALADLAAGRGRLAWDGDRDPVSLGDRRVAARAVAIGRIFRSTFGSSASRVRTVLAFQYANPDRTRNQLEYVAAVHGRPSSLLSAIAIAPYVNLGFDPDGESLDVPGLTTDGVLGLLSEDIDGFAGSPFMPTWRTLSTRFSLPLVAYEGGPDTFGPNNIDAKTSATLDPRMRGLVERYLGAWFAQGGGQFNWYTLGADPYGHRYGTWSISDSITRLDSPKSLGFMSVRDGS